MTRYAIGVRVKRGPDWEYGYQDRRGPGITIPGDVPEGWICVKWDYLPLTERYRYRIGAERAYDLAFLNKTEADKAAADEEKADADKARR